MYVFQVFINRFIDKQFISNYNDAPCAKTFFEEYFEQYNATLDFFLLVFSVVLVAAAGNIINDYFDVKADRINKPERLIVGTHIKRRWAMFMHWSFSSVGSLIALYLSWQYNNWWLFIISVVSVNILWFYSSVFKRKFLSGNIMVASLLGIVPIYVYVFNLNRIYTTLPDKTFDASGLIFKITFMLAGIAFLINLIREFIKDIADVRGDLQIGSRTLPIVLGIRRTKTGIILLTLILLGSVYLYFRHVYDVYLDNLPAEIINGQSHTIFSGTYHYFNLCLLAAGVLIVLSVLISIFSEKRKLYLLSSNILKLAMVFGLFSPLFL